MKVSTRIQVAVVLLVVVAVSALLVASFAFADHMTEMEICASHGLGPNFQYAEGPDSALQGCLSSADTAAHSWAE